MQSYFYLCRMGTLSFCRTEQISTTTSLLKGFNHKHVLSVTTVPRECSQYLHSQLYTLFPKAQEHSTAAKLMCLTGLFNDEKLLRVSHSISYLFLLSWSILPHLNHSCFRVFHFLSSCPQPLWSGPEKWEALFEWGNPACRCDSEPRRTWKQDRQPLERAVT